MSKEFIFKPGIKVEKDKKTGEDKKIVSPFEGEIKVKVPKYKDRLKLLKECNFKMDDKGEISKGTDQFDSVEKVVEIAESHILQVNVKHKETEEEFDSVEGLSYTQEGSELINDIGNMVLSGFKLGKN